MIAAIPTTYRQLNFRSRLEAQWARFFDLLGWPWEYEAIDLDGYIPDFMLKFHKPLLVEVKPELVLRELYRYVDKVKASGWSGEALIVGATLFADDCPDHPCLGLLGERLDDPEYPDRKWWEFAEGLLFTCNRCRKTSIFHKYMSYACRNCGVGDGDHHMRPLEEDVLSLWFQAKNTTQWKRRG